MVRPVRHFRQEKRCWTISARLGNIA
jgi:hypothetical protein